ncbi:MAG: FAD-linked oxidase C-terminal domain-containing protein [Pseudomonadota bacterium]|nr:FAD-linked oxidase C-terminal domain-containing protein [Pseudomonadota bacterium]
MTNLLNDLKVLLGDRLSTAEATRLQFAKDESHHSPKAPDAVVHPISEEEVSQIVKICSKHQTPIIPFGAGTSLEGGVGAVHGGICIDMSRMNNILRVNDKDLDAIVEAGVTRKQLNSHLRDTGLFFPIDPGADATIGGMASTRASGTNAVRYGTMRENVLNVKVVLANGEVIKTGGRARKSSAGYDITRLFVGAEGTLGVITEITLRLHGIPESITSAVCSFPSVESAVDCSVLTIQSGIPVARVELLDKLQMQACIQYSSLNYEVSPALFFEFHGSLASVREQAELVQSIATNFGGQRFRWAEKIEERNQLWHARHNALYAALALKPGAQAWSTDVCVPVSRLSECIEKTRLDIDKSSATATILGHVGDGNFHVIFLIDPECPEDLLNAQRINERMISRAISMEGTCTGEHGVGMGKLKYLEEEFGDALDIMHNLKRVLDPENLMNPGKVVRLTN